MSLPKTYAVYDPNAPLAPPTTAEDRILSAKPPVEKLDMKGRNKRPKKNPVLITSANIEWADKKAHPDQVLRALKWVRNDFGATTKAYQASLDHYYFIKKADGTYANRTNKKVGNYAIGGTFFVINANKFRSADCGAGLNVGTVEWIMLLAGSSASPIGNTDVLIEVEFTRKDVACFPTRVSDKWVRGNPRKRYADEHYLYLPQYSGKFRLHSFKVINARCVSEREVEVTNGGENSEKARDLRMKHRHVPMKCGWIKDRMKARKMAGLS